MVQWRYSTEIVRGFVCVCVCMKCTTGVKVAYKRDAMERSVAVADAVCMGRVRTAAVDDNDNDENDENDAPVSRVGQKYHWTATIIRYAHDIFRRRVRRVLSDCTDR